jgi:AcrR family transcriptional regulator
MSRPRLVSDQQILDAARRCFVEDGAQCPISRVAAALGISQPALFKRFGSKRALLLAALLPSEPPQWVAELSNGPDDRPLVEQIKEVADRALRFFDELVPVLATLRSAGLQPKEIMQHFPEPPPVLAIAGLCGWLERCHEQKLIRAVDFRLTALSFIGAMHSKGFLTYALGIAPAGGERDTYAQSVADLYAHALERRP